jgi:hypothetical protein
MEVPLTVLLLTIYKAWVIVVIDDSLSLSLSYFIFVNESSKSPKIWFVQIQKLLPFHLGNAVRYGLVISCFSYYSLYPPKKKLSLKNTMPVCLSLTWILHIFLWDWCQCFFQTDTKAVRWYFEDLGRNRFDIFISSELRHF